MAIKPILDIEIDPENKLGAYIDKFKEYEAALKKTPAVWSEAGAEAKGITTSFESGLAALLAMIDAAQSVADRTDDARRNANDVGDSWKRAAGWSKDFAGNIKDAAFSFTKLVGLGSLIGGLVGAGSLFGLDRLAGNVGAGRRSSTGLGLTYGEQKAFEVDLGRLVDPTSFLGGVNESLSDVSKRRFLFAAGLDNSNIAGKDTAQVSLNLLTSIKRLADHTDPAMLGQLLSARGLGQFGLSVEDLRRLRATPPAELAEFLHQFHQDQAAFGFDPATQKKWQDLNRALSAAETKIESALVFGLTPFAEKLPQLSDAIANTITTFLKSPQLKVWMTDFGTGVMNLAKTISSKDFQNDIKTFVTDMGLVAEALVHGLKWLHIIPDPDKKPPKKTPMSGWQAAGTLLNPFDLSPSDNADAAQVLSKSIPEFFSATRHDPYSLRTEQRYNLPSGLLEKVYGAETNYGRGSMISPAGAKGPFQFMPDTAKRYSLSDSFDLQTSTDAAGHYFSDLLKKYHGDVSKALAAYNWGEGHLDRDIGKYGIGWRQHLPKETHDYLAKILADGGGSGVPRFDVHFPTTKAATLPTEADHRKANAILTGRGNSASSHNAPPKRDMATLPTEADHRKANAILTGRGNSASSHNAPPKRDMATLPTEADHRKAKAILNARGNSSVSHDAPPKRDMAIVVSKATYVASDISRHAVASAPHTNRNSTITHKVASDVKVTIKVNAAPGSNPVVNASQLSVPQ